MKLLTMPVATSLQDVLVPAILNRAGLVVVSSGGREVWVGGVANTALYSALAPLQYTVLWSTQHPHLRPDNAGLSQLPLEAKFIFKDVIPLNGVLGQG